MYLNYFWWSCSVSKVLSYQLFLHLNNYSFCCRDFTTLLLQNLLWHLEYWLPFFILPTSISAIGKCKKNTMTFIRISTVAMQNSKTNKGKRFMNILLHSTWKSALIMFYFQSFAWYRNYRSKNGVFCIFLFSRKTVKVQSTFKPDLNFSLNYLKLFLVKRL